MIVWEKVVTNIVVPDNGIIKRMSGIFCSGEPILYAC
jgi:hypothetical protein